MLVLDHLAVVCENLEDGTAWVAAQLGVALQEGGQHPRYGTHNTLLGLAEGLYLEVIAKEPGVQPKAGHAWFGLDQFTGPPRLANWICRTDDLAAAIGKGPAAAGVPRALTRGDLSWQITVPDDGSLPLGGGFPTLIQWDAGTRHPATRLPDSGCRLVRFTVTHPDAPAIADMMDLQDPRVLLETGPYSLRATFDTPHGLRVLG